ncbi:MAG: hypothetical protein PF440_11945 [Thiomicrorhabdus sp.]|jgi:hypothetical protein|nr:hypothetical protein [Thiomicrorhabdus sp.]
MKKSYPNTVLSQQVCKTKGCRNKIKQRLFEKKADFDYCYKHWKDLEFARRGGWNNGEG